MLILQGKIIISVKTDGICWYFFGYDEKLLLCAVKISIVRMTEPCNIFTRFPRFFADIIFCFFLKAFQNVSYCNLSNDKPIAFP